MIHDFEGSYAKLEARAAEDEPLWDRFYRARFPDLAWHQRVPRGVPSQKLGHDRVIYLGSGITYYVDEKIRDKDWPDVLLEYVSVSTTGAPGWIEKPLQIHFLAYAWRPSGRVRLYEWTALRAAWRANKARWLKEHRLVDAVNRDYTTRSVPVPEPVLEAAYRKAGGTYRRRDP